jgi:hypothetical protein
MQQADRDQKFPNLMQSRQNDMSKIYGRECSTFQFHLLGQQLYFTSDPKNIQTMLANNFDDYALGPARRNNMIVSLGDGIVSPLLK